MSLWSWWFFAVFVRGDRADGQDQIHWRDGPLARCGSAFASWDARAGLACVGAHANQLGRAQHSFFEALLLQGGRTRKASMFLSSELRPTSRKDKSERLHPSACAPDLRPLETFRFPCSQIELECHLRLDEFTRRRGHEIDTPPSTPSACAVATSHANPNP